MSNNNGNSYNNDRPVVADCEYASDPASGGFFHSDYKKHDDLKQMLDANKDGLKLEAMKRIIGMVAKGRDASDLFPAVVKNVVSKNLEVKKLVYVYLVRYAEEQQDLALLSISTFQRALKDHNQLIRASALRVLSSIRVPMIVPIVMLAIKDSALDMSPYVRKTAAHAIPKLYRLDPEQKEDLVQLIDKLLADKTTLVVGSAVMAFEEVCPERIDLVHKNYRKLCNLLIDVDEWGQVVIMNMLTRYGRTQFTDPNIHDESEVESQNFYEDSERSDDEKDHETQKVKSSVLDPDHKLLLKQSKPLLQSRNAAVVMAVAQLYHHLAPKPEVLMVAKALIRLLRSRREVQSVVLNCIASLSTLRRGMFEPFLQSFFVRTNDPTHIKLLKLEILTNLGTEINIGVILREFQTYISSNDKIFVAAAIQAIGRCAASIKEVTDTCLAGLVSLLSNRDEAVVAESVVVIKKLFQSQPNAHQEIIKHMAKILDHITNPQARASILWLLGEYCERVPKIAPDVLRKMAKTFINEEDIVKQQVLNLAVKLYLTNPTQTTALCHYMFTLARYDQNYDLRDRARFLRLFILPSSGNSKLEKQAKKIFLAPKPAPVLESKFKDRQKFQLASLSHYIDSCAYGYHELPPFPEVAPDQSVRNVEVVVEWPDSVKAKHKTKIGKKKSFYSESEQSSEAESLNENVSEEESSDEKDESDDDEEEEEESESEDSDEEENSSNEESPIEEDSDDDDYKKTNKSKLKKKNEDSENGNEDESDEEDEYDEEDDQENEEEKSKKSKSVSSQSKQSKKKEEHVLKSSKTNLDLLLELDDGPPTSTPILTPSVGGFNTALLTPLGTSNVMSVEIVGPSFVPYKGIELINKLSGGGLSIEYRFTRSPHLFSYKMVSIELIFINHGPDDVNDIKMGSKDSTGGIVINDFTPISSLKVNGIQSGLLGVDLNDSTQPIHFTITTSSGRNIKVSFKTPVGEIIRAVSMPESFFNSERYKLKGMNEHSESIPFSPEITNQNLSQKIYECANVGPIPSSETNILKYAGETLSSKSLVLITVKREDSKILLSVNCEKMVIGSMLLNDLKSSLKSLSF